MTAVRCRYRLASAPLIGVAAAAVLAEGAARFLDVAPMHGAYGPYTSDVGHAVIADTLVRELTASNLVP
jgi:hypothetical protein